MSVVDFPKKTNEVVKVTVHYLVPEMEPDVFYGDFFGVSTDAEDMIMIGTDDQPTDLITMSIIKRISLEYIEPKEDV